MSGIYNNKENADILPRRNKENFKNIEGSRVNIGVGGPYHTDCLPSEECEILSFSVVNNLALS